MPIDPSIAMSYKPVQIQDPMEMYGKRQQIQANALAMQKNQTDVNEKNALAQIINQPGYNLYDPQAQAAAIRAAPTLAPAMFKNLNDARLFNVDYDTKTQALATARRTETEAKRVGAVKQIVNHDTVDSVVSDVKSRVATGELDQNHADAILASLPQTDEGMSAWKLKTLHNLLTTSEQLEQTTINKDLGGMVQTIVGSKFAGGPAPQVTTVNKTATPGDLLTAAAAASSLAQNAAQFTVTTGLKKQELGQKGKEISAQEAKTAFLSSRIFNAATEISDVTTKNPDFFKKGMWEAAFGGGALSNFVNPAERQIVSSAIGEITDAALTLGTGAAYTKEQIQQKKRFYEPAFTDKPETVQIKKTRFKQLMMDTKKQAGEAWTPEMDAAVAALFPPPPAVNPKTTIPRAGTPPKGISQKTWDYMKPQERKLWPR